MIEQDFVIKNKLGLHLRPATMLTQKIGKYKSSVKIMHNDEIVDAKSVLGITTLAIGCGESIKFLIEGEDEQEVLSVIKDLVEHRFYTEPPYDKK